MTAGVARPPRLRRRRRRDVLVGRDLRRHVVEHLRRRAVLDEDLVRKERAGRQPGLRDRVAAQERIALRGLAREHGVARVDLERGDEHERDDRDAGGEHEPAAPHHEPAPAPPDPRLGRVRIDELLRHHAQPVDPRAEDREHRRQQRDRREHGDRGDEHPAEADRADERQRDDEHAEQADRDRRAGDDHRAARVRHRLDERLFRRVVERQLLAEAEDDEERVVDRDAETDERDEELDDDRHVREVGEAEDAEERRQDRRDRDDDRHRDRGERAEDEDQHDERAGAAEERLREDARALVGALRLEDRVAAGEMHLDARRGDALQRGANLVDRRLRRERRVPGRIQRREHRVPVLRDVRVAVAVEPRADAARALDLRPARVDRGADARDGRDVVARAS